MKKLHGDALKSEAAERREAGRSSGRQAAKLDAKKTFHCDRCDASFMREDSLRSHKRQHSEYGDGKGADGTVLQLRVDAGKPPAAPLAVGHLQVPLPPTPAPQICR